MVQTALAPAAEAARIADARWVAQTADHILSVMEESRSTWQMWHVRAEAQRQVRTTGVTAQRASALVDLLVDEVLDRRSVALAAPHDGIEEPEVLRRADGSSVYTVAGAALYTSQRIHDAEQRLLTAAGQRGGASVEHAAVDLALLEMAANGTALDAGQASLVRQMCTSGGTSAARDRTRRRREDHRYARPHSRLDPRGWPCARSGAVGCCGRRPCSEHRYPQRHARQAHLVAGHGDLPEWAAAAGPSTLGAFDHSRHRRVGDRPKVETDFTGETT
jgi:hypothetical protein